MRFKHLLMASAVAAGGGLCCAAASPAHAQATAQATPTINEVVVTAQKREQNLQRVPIAVTAIQGQQFHALNIRQPSDLTQHVPSLVIPQGTASTPSGLVAIIRGQAPSDVLLSLSTPVGIYEDGFNIPHPVGTNLAFFDISSVEVLKGPQGTLYGRNTSSGAINILTRNADYDGLHGFGYAEGGNFADWKLGGAVNVPIVNDVLAIRLAYQHWNRDGFGQSAISGQRFGGEHDDDTFRASIRFDPTTNFTANFKMEYDHANLTDAMFQTRFLGLQLGGLANTEWALEGSTGGVPPSVLVANTNASGNLFTNYSDVNQFEHLSVWHAVADATWHLTPDIDLRSITGYHEFTDFRVFDLASLPAVLNNVGVGVGGLTLPPNFHFPPPIGIVPSGLFNPFPLQPDQHSGQISQEFDAVGNSFDSRLHWLVGAYYSYDTGNGNQSVEVTPLVFTAGFGAPIADVNFDELKNTVSTWGIYTHNDFKFNDWFSLTAGLRYSGETIGQTLSTFTFIPQTAPNFFHCSAGFANAGMAVISPEGCAVGQSASFDGWSYLFSANFQITPDVLFYAKTARGFQGSAFQVRALAPAFAPEVNTEYEIGLKSEFLDHRLRLNLAAYHDNYSNLQQSVIEVINDVSTTVITTSQARIEGVEWEVTAVPVEHLTLTATGDYLDATYTNFPNAPLADGPNPEAPTGSVNATGLSFAGLPHWTVNFGGHYDVPNVGPGDLSFQINYFWRSELVTNILNNWTLYGLSPAIQSEWRQAVGLVNANIDYILPRQGLTFSIFATNLGNLHYQTDGLAGLPFGFTGQTQEPRMWGISVRKTFGPGE